MTNDSRRTLTVDGYRRQGNLLLNGEGQWTFVQRDSSGTASYSHDISDLPTTWRDRLLDGSLELGWQDIPRAHHVSARGMLRGVPPSFKQSMKKTYADYQVWLDSYTEEYCALRDHGTFVTITFEEYKRDYSHISIIPTMNVQTVKKDEDGQPVRAKSRIVVLGNL